jgi:hypothetical protein
MTAGHYVFLCGGLEDGETERERDSVVVRAKR